MLSIILPAYDAPPHLEAVLAALSQHLPHLDCATEVLVVDDGSPDAHVIQDLVAAYPVRWAYLDPPSADFRAGQARNLGASLAQGARLLFLDADCQVTSLDSLRIHAALGAEQIVLAGGIAVAPSHPQEPTLPDRRYQLYGLQPQLAQFQPLATQDYRPFWSGNLSVPHRLFTQLGGFWEAIEGYGSEDQELAWRLQAAGCQLQLDLRYPVRHLGPQRRQLRPRRRLEVLARSRQEPSLVRPGRFLPPAV